MPQNQPGGGHGPDAHHVLVRAAKVGRNDFQDNPVRDFSTLGVFKLNKINALHLDLAGLRYTTPLLLAVLLGVKGWEKERHAAHRAA